MGTWSCGWRRSLLFLPACSGSDSFLLELSLSSICLGFMSMFAGASWHAIALLYLTNPMATSRWLRQRPWFHRATACCFAVWSRRVKPNSKVLATKFVAVLDWTCPLGWNLFQSDPCCPVILPYKQLSKVMGAFPDYPVWSSTRALSFARSCRVNIRLHQQSRWRIAGDSGCSALFGPILPAERRASPCQRKKHGPA